MTSDQTFKLEAALKIHLLLVDDESEFKEVMQQHLGRAGTRRCGAARPGGQQAGSKGVELTYYN